LLFVRLAADTAIHVLQQRLDMQSAPRLR